MVEDVARAYQALPYETKASMLVDLENGRRLELPWLSGAVARIGREVGVPTPDSQLHRGCAEAFRERTRGLMKVSRSSESIFALATAASTEAAPTRRVSR